MFVVNWETLFDQQLPGKELNMHVLGSLVRRKFWGLNSRSGFEWSGFEWSGFEWSGFEWSGFEWSGFEWSDHNTKHIAEQDWVACISGYFRLSTSVI